MIASTILLVKKRKWWNTEMTKSNDYEIKNQNEYQYEYQYED